MYNQNLTKSLGAICAEPIDISQTLRVVPKTTEQQDRLDEALKRHIMFAHLETEEKKSIFDAMSEVSFKQNDTIIKQGTRKFYENSIKNYSVKIPKLILRNFSIFCIFLIFEL